MENRKELEETRETEDAVPVREEEAAPGSAREREVGLIDGVVPL